MKLLSRYLRGTPAFTPLQRSPDPQCIVITRAGKRCKLPKKPGSDKCAMHLASR